ncbi:MAG: choice-of-anchor D domain-containing protein, partial [Candidatus Latescibacteria bacterium]|nr:choice-of-anchor D domain-containing protein [Candidatus Latescibacterota bacterium]
MFLYSVSIARIPDPRRSHRLNRLWKVWLSQRKMVWAWTLFWVLLFVGSSTPVTAAVGSVTLVGQYNTPGSANGVAVSGQYTYIGDGPNGLQVINIGNPANPVLAGSLATDGPGLGLSVVGNYVYLADQAGGLKIINVTNPTQPTLTGQYVVSGRYAYDVAVQSTTAYIAYDFLGLQIVNVANPSNPQLLKGLGTPSWAYELFPSGNYGYLVHSAAGMLVIDISNPATAQQVASLNLSGNPEGVFVAGQYAYVAAYGVGLHVIDISIPSNPRLVATATTPPYATKVFIQGSYAYVTNGPFGIQVLDISNPLSPQLVGTYDTPGNANDITVSNGLIYVADGDAGLVILRLTPPSPHLMVTPTSLAFETILVGQSTTKALTVQNTGTADLAVTDINDPFFTVSDTAFTIAPGDSHAVIVTFSPMTTGTAVDTLLILSNDPGTPIFHVPVQGTAISPPQLLHLTLSHVFGATGETAAMPLTLTNPTTTPVDGLQAQIVPGDPAHVHFESLSDSVASLGFLAAASTSQETTTVLIYTTGHALIPPGMTTLGRLVYHIDAATP